MLASDTKVTEGGPIFLLSFESSRRDHIREGSVEALKARVPRKIGLIDCPERRLNERLAWPHI